MEAPLVAAPVEAPLAAPQGLGWTLDDCTRLAAARPQQVGRRAAHDFLGRWRQHRAEADLEEDLTNGATFDWMSYVAKHPDRAAIFGEDHRITRVQIMALPDIYDTNMKGPRVDFVLSRSDGAQVRLHPGGKVEAKAVVHQGGTHVAQQMRKSFHDVAPPLAATQGKGEGKGGKGKGGKDKGDAAGKGAEGKGAEAPPGERGFHFEGASRADLIPTKVVKA